MDDVSFFGPSSSFDRLGNAALRLPILGDITGDFTATSGMADVEFFKSRCSHTADASAA